MLIGSESPTFFLFPRIGFLNCGKKRPLYRPLRGVRVWVAKTKDASACYSSQAVWQLWMNDTGENQVGFPTSRGCVDWTHTILQLSERNHASQRPTAMVFGPSCNPWLHRLARTVAVFPEERSTWIRIFIHWVGLRSMTSFHHFVIASGGWDWRIYYEQLDPVNLSRSRIHNHNTIDYTVNQEVRPSTTLLILRFTKRSTGAGKFEVGERIW